MSSNIVLIGVPGGGKSTDGVVLAKMMGMDFVDCDLLIIKREKRRLQDIIDRVGVKGFLKIEAEVIQSMDCENTVIATGGSAVLDEKSVEALKKLGTLVYLYHPYEEIVRRIPNLNNRGIAFEKGQTLETMFDYREPIYRRVADVIINAENHTVEENATEVIKSFC